jgi:hypothetical protein
MSANIKCLLFILILVPSTLFVGRMVQIQMRMNYLRHADHAQILRACREAITNRGSYKNDNPFGGSDYKNEVMIFRPLPDNLPQAIRELHPRMVTIRSNSVLINLTLPPSRMCLLAFEPDAKQYGTFRYIDGLWFWNGNDSTKNGAN